MLLRKNLDNRLLLIAGITFIALRSVRRWFAMGKLCPKGIVESTAQLLPTKAELI